ncbi:MAG: tRNA pseudouridine(55) synthase TruB, partial [Atopobium sp.]|nr:tRNA pseudouridine(55) synthase TruB [Atopobium sp.]
TKLLGLLTLDRKGYVADISFGARTSTDDADGQVVATAAVPENLCDEEFARAACAKLVGTVDQLPPTVSAISVDGKRAYQLVREGKTPELAARRVAIYDATLLAVPAPSAEDDSLVWTVAFDVSKGTYIRSIARDLGQSLGTEAHISGLRRTFSGPITLGSCALLEELEQSPAQVLEAKCLNPTEVLGYPVHRLTGAEYKCVEVGKRFGIPEDLSEVAHNSLVSLVWNDALVGIWTRQGSCLVCQTNFSQGILCK